MQNRVQFQNADFNPTIDHSPAYIMMKDPQGFCLTFDMSTGRVHYIALSTETLRRPGWAY